MNTRIKPLAVTLLTLTLAVLSGCAQTSGNWDKRFGTSLRASLASQVVNPAAARNANPVEGMDGRAAGAVQKGYETSFAQPSPQQSIISGSGK